MDIDNYNFDELENLIDKLDGIKQEKKDKFINTYWCASCNDDKTIIDSEKGIIICKLCGDVISNMIDMEQEWNGDGGKDGVKSSMYVNALLPQSSIATTIHGVSSRITTIHKWLGMPYHERSLNEVFREISNKCKEGKILKCIEDDAKIMYKNINDSKIITRGSNRKSLIAACVFFACRKNNKIRSPKEIAHIFSLKYTEITKGCKTFMKLGKRTMDISFIFAKPEHFINRFKEDTKIKNEYAEQAIKIANNVEKICIASMHTPISIAAGAIYMMVMINGFKINKKDIADQFKISQVTISKAYKKIEKYFKILYDEKIVSELEKEITEYKNNIAITDITALRFIRFGIKHPRMFNILNKDNKVDNELIMLQKFELDYLIQSGNNKYLNEILLDNLQFPMIYHYN